MMFLLVKPKYMIVVYVFQIELITMVVFVHFHDKCTGNVSINLIHIWFFDYHRPLNAFPAKADDKSFSYHV